MRIRVEHDIDALATDLRAIVPSAVKDMRATIREAARVGNTVARDNARRTAGGHGKLYPKAFSWESASWYGFGAGVFTAEYGPDSAKPQGGMSFEHGSRNQPPHNDLAKSADLIGPAFAQEVAKLADDWFWR